MHCICDPAIKGGYAFSQFLGDLMHDCVYSPADTISVILGFANILLWTIATIPQMRQNYLRKNVDALDVRFLLIWLVGDSMSFLGSVFTDQVPLMRYTGFLFALNDVVLSAQYFYYTRIYSRAKSETEPLLVHRSNTPGSMIGGSNTPGSMIGGSNTMVTSIVLIACFLPAAADSFSASPPLCNSPPNVSETVKTIGIIMSWCSNSSYVIARFPQIIKNSRRKSVDGLSMELFIIGLIANVCYGFSIGLRVPALDSNFFLTTFPFIASVCCTTCTDTFILCQGERAESKERSGRNGM